MDSAEGIGTATTDFRCCRAFVPIRAISRRYLISALDMSHTLQNRKKRNRGESTLFIHGRSGAFHSESYRNKGLP
jgi:hypothetical protein